MTAEQVGRALGISASQVRRDIAAGAPTIRARRPAHVDRDQFRAWRAGTGPAQRDIAELLGNALLDVLRRDCGTGLSADAALGIPQHLAALLLLAVFDRSHRQLTGRDAPLPLPEPVRLLRVVAGLPPDPPE